MEWANTPIFGICIFNKLLQWEYSSKRGKITPLPLIFYYSVLFRTNSIAHFKKIFNDFCVKKEKLGNFAEWGNILLPYIKPSPCLKKFSKLHFLRQKLSATSWLPLASSCLRTMRQKLSALFQGFPSGGKLYYCLISSLPLGGKVLSVSEADEGQFQIRYNFL